MSTKRKLSARGKDTTTEPSLRFGMVRNGIRNRVRQAIIVISQKIILAGKNSFDPELFFAALADKTRLRLLNLMSDSEVCTCFFADTLETNDPKISRRLAYLKPAGLVKGRRDGKWVHYSLVEPADSSAREIFNATLKMLKADKSMKQDRKLLINVCCAPQQSVTILSRK